MPSDKRETVPEADGSEAAGLSRMQRALRARVMSADAHHAPAEPMRTPIRR